MNSLVFGLCFAFANAGCLKGNAPAAPKNGKLVFDSPTDLVNEDSVARMVCRGGYKHDPSLTLKCSDENWTGDLGECVAQGCPKEYIEKLVGASGKLNYEPEAIGEMVPHLTKALHGCRDGYEIRGTTKNGEILCDLDACVAQYESLSSNDTFLCHFGTWVGRLGPNQCVPIQNKTTIGFPEEVLQYFRRSMELLPSDLETECNSLPAYKLYGFDSCFVAVETAGPQTEWETVCTHMPGIAGHLAVIPNGRLLDYIREGFKPPAPWVYWFGAKRETTAADPYANWKWLLADGIKENAHFEKYKMDFLSFNNYNNIEDCPALLVEYRIVLDDPCSKNVFYLCQYDSQSKVRHFQLYAEQMKGSSESLIGTYELTNVDSFVVDCASMCRDHALCYSFAIEKPKSMCYLYMDFGHSAQFPAQNDPNFTLYNRI